MWMVPKSFSFAWTLKKHIRRVHEGQREYECKSCGKSFFNSQTLKKHIRTIHEGRKDIK